MTAKLTRVQKFKIAPIEGHAHHSVISNVTGRIETAAAIAKLTSIACIGSAQIEDALRDTDLADVAADTLTDVLRRASDRAKTDAVLLGVATDTCTHLRGSQVRCNTDFTDSVVVRHMLDAADAPLDADERGKHC